MYISMRMQIIVAISVLVSMIDFMPGKCEHETGSFATFKNVREKRCDVVALRSYRRDVTHQTSTKWWNRDYV